MSWLPNEWPKTVVMIERAHQGEKGREFIPIGTGFITEYGKFNVLVTCKHIVFDLTEKQLLPNLFVSFNLRNGTRARRSFDEMKQNYSMEWLFSEDESVDLALMPYEINEQTDDVRRMGRDLYESIDNLFEGDEIFFLGFPLGIDTGIQNALRPVVRQGIISLIQQDKNFIIDAHVFPGNSGSPVFLKPAIIDFKTQTFRAAKFIGIINSYIPYLDTAISLYTKRPRVIFEENSGLARVIGAHYINEILKSSKFEALVKDLG